MDSDLKECPACGEKIKDVVFGSNLIIASSENAIINEYHAEKPSHRCVKCGDALYIKYKEDLIKERDTIVRKIQNELPSIPIASVHSPLHWEYSILGLVTSQTTTGTGVFSEFTSAFTDLFGTQSKAYNKKLKAGEDICKSMLRKETLDLGGNAVLAADIDYAEVGGGKGMLMICMTGTAVLLKNPEVLGTDIVQSFTVISELKARLDHLAQYRF